MLIEQGPRPTRYALKHYDHDVFIFTPVGENAFAVGGTTFTIGPNGQAIDVLLDNLNVFGQGTFTRIPAGT